MYAANTPIPATGTGFEDFTSRRHGNRGVGGLQFGTLDSRDERRPYPGAARPTSARCLPAWLMSFSLVSGLRRVMFVCLSGFAHAEFFYWSAGIGRFGGDELALSTRRLEWCRLGRPGNLQLRKQPRCRHVTVGRATPMMSPTPQYGNSTLWEDDFNKSGR